MKESALVTGGNGFVGRAICQILADRAWSVTALGRSPRPEKLPKEYGYLQADLRSTVAITGQSWDLVVHAAADLGSDARVLTDNLISTRAALETALAAEAKFIQLSSLPLIGRPEFLPINEAHPVRPESEYHLGKYSAELLAALPRYASLRPVSLRFASPLGPGRTAGRFVPALLAALREGQPLRLLGQGGRVQNYIDLDDLGRAVALAAENPAVEGIFLIAGHSLSNLEMARLSRELFGKNSEIIFEGSDHGENVRWLVDGRKAEEFLGYRPQIPMTETLRKIWEHGA